MLNDGTTGDQPAVDLVDHLPDQTTIHGRARLVADRRGIDQLGSFRRCVAHGHAGIL